MTIKFEFSLNSNRITQRVRYKFIVHNVCIMHDDDDDDSEDSSMYRKKLFNLVSSCIFRKKMQYFAQIERSQTNGGDCWTERKSIV